MYKLTDDSHGHLDFLPFLHFFFLDVFFFSSYKRVAAVSSVNSPELFVCASFEHFLNPILQDFTRPLENVLL